MLGFTSNFMGAVLETAFILARFYFFFKIRTLNYVIIIYFNFFLTFYCSQFFKGIHDLRRSISHSL